MPVSTEDGEICVCLAREVGNAPTCNIKVCPRLPTRAAVSDAFDVLEPRHAEICADCRARRSAVAHSRPADPPTQWGVA